MYKRDVALIEDYVAQSPEHMFYMFLFVWCTIQKGLSTVELQMDDYFKEGVESRHLNMGHKREGVEYYRQNASWLWGRLHYLRDMGRNDPEIIAEAILMLLDAPGLGIAKSGFVLQCMGFDVACMDSHNLKRMGLKEGAFKDNPKAKRATRLKRNLAYVKICQQEGSEYWWDSWCHHVAGNRANKRLITGDAVSAFHVHCITKYK